MNNSIDSNVFHKNASKYSESQIAFFLKYMEDIYNHPESAQKRIDQIVSYDLFLNSKKNSRYLTRLFDLIYRCLNIGTFLYLHRAVKLLRHGKIKIIEGDLRIQYIVEWHELSADLQYQLENYYRSTNRSAVHLQEAYKYLDYIGHYTTEGDGIKIREIDNFAAGLPLIPKDQMQRKYKTKNDDRIRFDFFCFCLQDEYNRELIFDRQYENFYNANLKLIRKIIWKTHQPFTWLNIDCSDSNCWGSYEFLDVIHDIFREIIDKHDLSQRHLFQSIEGALLSYGSGRIQDEICKVYLIGVPKRPRKNNRDKKLAIKISITTLLEEVLASNDDVSDFEVKEIFSKLSLKQLLMLKIFQDGIDGDESKSKRKGRGVRSPEMIELCGTEYKARKEWNELMKKLEDLGVSVPDHLKNR